MKSRQKMVLSGCWAARRLTRLISVPMAKTEPGGRGLDGFDDEVGGAGGVGGFDYGHGALGVDDDLDLRITGAGGGDLLYGEAFVDRAEAVPEDDFGRDEVRGGAAAEGLLGVPEGHLGEGDAHFAGGVAAEMLVREEEDALAAGEGPIEDGGGV